MDAEVLGALLSSVRYEVLPAKATVDQVLAHVPRDVVATVTASPVNGLESTLDLVGRPADEVVAGPVRRAKPPAMAAKIGVG
ncbi:hypothetical protein ACWC3X_39135, partial [Streptomyces populi]